MQQIDKVVAVYIYSLYEVINTLKKLYNIKLDFLATYSIFYFNFVIVSGRLIVYSNDSNYVPVSSWLLNATVCCNKTL